MVKKQNRGILTEVTKNKDNMIFLSYYANLGSKVGQRYTVLYHGNQSLDSLLKLVFNHVTFRRDSNGKVIYVDELPP